NEQKASERRCLRATYPNPRFDSMLLRFTALSEEDDLPVYAIGPIVDPYQAHLPHANRPAITFGRPLVRRPEDGGGKYPDLGGKVWDQYRRTEFILDFRRLLAIYGDAMYDEIPFTQSFGMLSSWGDLGVEQVFAIQVAKPEPPRISWIQPLAAKSGSTVSISGANLFGAKEVMFNRLRSPSFSVLGDQINAVVPDVPPLDPVEEDPIVIR